MRFLIIILGLFFSSAQALELNKITGYSTFSWDEGGSEIAAYDPSRSRIFVTNNLTKTVDVLSIANLPYTKKEISINPRAGVGGINSVAVSEEAGLLALAIEAENKQENGMVLFYNLGTLKLAFGYSVGALPDNVAFSPDGKYALVANEGEPNDDYSIDPKGSVSIIDLNNWFVGPSEDRIRHVYFTRNGAPEGGRIVKPGATFEQDAEPEYIAVSGDSKHAYVSLQENNVIAKINLEYGIVTDYFGLGYKDWSQSALDASNKDNRVNIQPWPVKGMYQPDTIVVVTKEINGEMYDYILMANEGDAKDYDGFSEEVRVKDLALDPSAFPNAKELQQSENLGRLKTTTTMGDSNGDGLYEEIYGYGGRSFAIMDGNSGKIIYDSGNDIAVRTAFNGFFNWNEDAGSFDDRSDDKGAEPEAITVGEIDGKTYAFVGLERQGGIMMYDITGIIKPKFVGYFNGRNFFGDGTKMTGGDISPESLVFIPADKTPPAYKALNNGPLLIGAYELSGSTAVYQISNN